MFSVAGATCFDFNPNNSDIFLVGSEEGKIYQCSRAYNQQYLNVYEVLFDAVLLSCYLINE